MVTYPIIIEFLAINWAITWVVIAEEVVTVSNLRAILDTDVMGSFLVWSGFGLGIEPLANGRRDAVWSDKRRSG